jgi:tartrate dehydratase beta subunit/fumarate hydratase class I family protein
MAAKFRWPDTMSAMPWVFACACDLGPTTAMRMRFSLRMFQSVGGLTMLV